MPQPQRGPLPSPGPNHPLKTMESATWRTAGEILSNRLPASPWCAEGTPSPRSPRQPGGRSGAHGGADASCRLPVRIACHRPLLPPHLPILACVHACRWVGESFDATPTQVSRPSLLHITFHFMCAPHYSHTPACVYSWDCSPWCGKLRKRFSRPLAASQASLVGLTANASPVHPQMCGPECAAHVVYLWPFVQDTACTAAG